MRNAGNREKYMAEAFPVEDEVLRRIRQELVLDGKDGIQIGVSDARLLQFLARLAGAKMVVEVGTLYGYSTLCWARALPEDGVVFSVDVEEAHHRKARDLLAGAKEDGKKIRLITGDARVKLAELSPLGPFDIVFIDANKIAYLDYLDWAEENVRPGGLIVGDNTFLFGAMYGESRDPQVNEKARAVMSEFNRRLANTKKYNSCIVPTSEGITVAQRLS
jgi:predicted O-methyltransferase YrrM